MVARGEKPLALHPSPRLGRLQEEPAISASLLRVFETASTKIQNFKRDKAEAGVQKSAGKFLIPPPPYYPMFSR
jgi:hypothetical protein